MKIKTFLIVLSSFFLALFFGVFIFLQYNKEEKLSWANLGEPSTSKDFPEKEFLFSNEECEQTGGVLIYGQPLREPKSMQDYKFVCGEEGIFLGLSDGDIDGIYCCKYPELFDLSSIATVSSSSKKDNYRDYYHKVR